jgi:hypothetical protein
MSVTQHSTGFSLPVGIALIVAGVMTILIAAIRHHRYIKALDRGQFRQSYGFVFTFLELSAPSYAIREPINFWVFGIYNADKNSSTGVGF